MSIVEVKKLVKKYPAFELGEVSFDIEEGKITGFIGRNGAGKTTTIKSMLNLIHPESGDMVYGGYPHSEIGIMRTQPEKTDTLIRDYADRNDLHYLNVFTDLKGSADYSESLKYIKIAKVIATLFGGFVILVCLVQIINSLQANMRMRNTEMWLYDVVGMDKSMKFKMIFIEYGLSAMAAFVFGCIASFIISFFSIKKLLDVTDSFSFVWPLGTAIVIGLAIWISLFSVIWIEINKLKV